MTSLPPNLAKLRDELKEKYGNASPALVAFDAFRSLMTDPARDQSSAKSNVAKNDSEADQNVRQWWVPSTYQEDSPESRSESGLTYVHVVEASAFEQANAKLAETTRVLNEKYAALTQADIKINEMALDLQSKDAEIAELEIGEGRRDAAIEVLQSQLAEKDAEIERLKARLEQERANFISREVRDANLRLTAANAKLEKLKDALKDCRLHHPDVSQCLACKALAEVEEKP